MQIELPLEKLTAAEKMELINTIWASLDPRELEMPEWHGEVLKERQKSARNEDAELLEIEVAEELVRNRRRASSAA